jgi:hypothetical protein
MLEVNVAAAADANAGAAHRNGARPHRRKRPPTGFLSVADVAELSHAAPSTVYHWIATGALGACKWRGVTIVDEQTAREFLAIKPLLRTSEGAAA